MFLFDVPTLTTLVNCLLCIILYVASFKLIFYFSIFILLKNLNNAKYVGGVLLNQKCKEFILSVFCQVNEVVTEIS